MNSPSFRVVKLFTKFILFILCYFLHVQTAHAWDVDFSRRQPDMERQSQATSSVPEGESTSFFKEIFQGDAPSQELVILHTAKGFVPEQLTLKKGVTYTIHVVNVDEKQRNVSFLLDSFSENHGLYFGVEKTFEIHPQVEGAFRYECPETAAQGKFVVTGESPKNDSHVTLRKMASDDALGEERAEKKLDKTNSESHNPIETETINP